MWLGIEESTKTSVIIGKEKKMSYYIILSLVGMQNADFTYMYLIQGA